MLTCLLALLAADGPPAAIYPDDPPWREVRNAAPSYAALHGWLHARRAAGEGRPAVVAVGSAARLEAAALARTAGFAWHGFADDAAAQSAGFAEPGIHWLLWDGPTLRHWRPAPLVPVPGETACPDGQCPVRPGAVWGR